MFYTCKENPRPYWLICLEMAYLHEVNFHQVKDQFETGNMWRELKETYCKTVNKAKKSVRDGGFAEVLFSIFNKKL